MTALRADGTDLRRIAAQPRGGFNVDWGINQAGGSGTQVGEHREHAAVVVV